MFETTLSNEKKAINTIVFSIVGNFFLALVKGFAGFFGNSYALIADAIESTTDIFSSIKEIDGSPLEEITKIDGFDADTAKELKERAKRLRLQLSLIFVQY